MTAKTSLQHVVPEEKLLKKYSKEHMLNIKSQCFESAHSPFKKFVQLAMLWPKLLLGTGSTSVHLYNDGYSPSTRNWDELPSGNVYERIISRNKDAYFAYLETMAGFRDDFERISLHKQNEYDPFWGNTAFSPFDAGVLYSLIASRKPSVYMEVGAGNSTKFVRRAINDHGLRTRIVSIDPHPWTTMDRVCDELVRARVETLPVERFAALGPGDVLFIDNSHRSFQNSDVTFFFTEILPNLKPGVVYGIHDIFLPRDYPQSWAMRFYNEQYLLMAYLLGGAGGDEILFPVSYMSYRDDVKTALLGKPGAKAPWGEGPLQGGAFWMVKA